MNILGKLLTLSINCSCKWARNTNYNYFRAEKMFSIIIDYYSLVYIEFKCVFFKPKIKFVDSDVNRISNWIF